MGLKTLQSLEGQKNWGGSCPWFWLKSTPGYLRSRAAGPSSPKVGGEVWDFGGDMEGRGERRELVFINLLTGEV